MAWLKIGHRGAAGTRPELTRPSFEKAMEVGVDMIELDVQLTRDGRLVVLHDRELGRTVRGEGPVRERSLAELCALDAGSWFGPEWAGTPVPSLEEVLDLTAGRVALNVEIKSPAEDWRRTAVAVVELLGRRARMASTVVSSFSVGALAAVRDLAPEARLGLLWHDADLNPAWAEARRLGAAALHLLWRLVDETAVRTAHERGLAVLAWTVNDRDEIDRQAELGVDGIISDFPEWFTGNRLDSKDGSDRG